jgi:CDP-diacylglycerol--glycerol-3-phosphate 3-phosphatidyltransferase
MPTVVANPRQARRSLERHWLLTAVLFAAALMTAYVALTWVWTPQRAGGWLVFAALVAVVELVLLWRILRHNHRPGDPRLLPTLGYGTALTLLCGLLLAMLAGFLFALRPTGLLGWLPALLYTLARVVDYLDGYVARITNHETALGSILDMELDGLGVLIAVVLGIQYGALPFWYLPLALSRQLFVAGLWWRKRRGLPVYEMTPSANRRIVAGYQTGFLSVALWPIYGPPVAHLGAVVFALPLIASFVRDWLVVSGEINPDHPAYIQWRARFKDLIEGWLPPVARLGGSIVAVALLLQYLPVWETHFAARGAAVWGLDRLAVLAVVAVPAYLFGVVGRVAALPLLALAWLDIAVRGLDWQDNVWLFIAAAIVTHVGSGYFAAWQPEEEILHRRPGSSPTETAQ